MSMRMKTSKFRRRHRTLIIIVAVVVGLFFAFSSINELAFTFGGKLYHAGKVNTIIKAMQNEDVDAIKRLFSKNAIEAIGEDKLEEDIRYLFTVIEGEIRSVEVGSGGMGNSVRGFKRSKNSPITTHVTTNVDTYRISFPDMIYNSFDRDLVGISRLVVQNQDDFVKYGWPAKSFKGVFRTDIVAAAFDKAQPADSIDTVLNALESGDADTFAGMFSQRALDEVGIDKIQAGAEYSCDVIDDEIVSYDANPDTYSYIVDGKVQMFVEMLCYVYTEETTYTVFYREFLIDEIVSEKTGIDRLLVQEKDMSGLWPLNWYADSMGIFCPENEDPRAFTNWADLQE